MCVGTHITKIDALKKSDTNLNAIFHTKFYQKYGKKTSSTFYFLFLYRFHLQKFLQK